MMSKVIVRDDTAVSVLGKASVGGGVSGFRFRV